MTKDNFARDHLNAFFQRIERLEEEKAALADDIREVYAEAKSNGFDAAIMRKVIRLRKMDAVERATMDEMIDLYMGGV